MQVKDRFACPANFIQQISKAKGLLANWFVQVKVHLRK